MVWNVSLGPGLLVAVHYFTQALACGPLPHQAERTDMKGETTYPYTLAGDGAAPDPVTMGNFINHLCINVRNLTESVDWYNRAFGLRLMFTMQVTEHFSISYMGHSHGGHNGTGYQTSEELNRQKNNIEGLIEFIHVDIPDWNLPSGLKMPNTFSHIGMVVPDIVATQGHLESIGANIKKSHNEPFVLGGFFADGSGLPDDLSVVTQEERVTIEQVLMPVNTPLIFVADPDGNIVEVQPQV